MANEAAHASADVRVAHSAAATLRGPTAALRAEMTWPRKPKEEQQIRAEAVLGCLGVELMMPERLAHHTHVYQMLLAIPGEDSKEDVVNLHETAQHRGACARPAGDGLGPPV